MPIRPENVARYPADWPEIRAAVLRRAGHRCEHEALGHRCGARHRELGWWRLGPGSEWRWVRLPGCLRDRGVDGPMTIATTEGPVKIIRIVLTIAHLDHTPENCASDNLRALCQRHHLAYDARHHASTRRSRRAALQMADLFDGSGGA